MRDSFLANPAAAAAGFFALVCLTIFPLFRTRNGILWAQLGAGIGFASHYALLGIAAPSLVNVLGSAQTIAALSSTRSEALNRIGYGLIPLMIAVGIYFGPDIGTLRRGDGANCPWPYAKQPVDLAIVDLGWRRRLVGARLPGRLVDRSYR